MVSFKESQRERDKRDGVVRNSVGRKFKLDRVKVDEQIQTWITAPLCKEHGEGIDPTAWYKDTLHKTSPPEKRRCAVPECRRRAAGVYIFWRRV